MHEVQLLPCSELAEIGFQLRDRQGRLQGEQAFDPEDAVIEVAQAGAVLEPAVVILLAGEKESNEIGGITKEPGRQTGHLQHFQTHAHPTFMAGAHPERESIWGWRPKTQ